MVKTIEKQSNNINRWRKIENKLINKSPELHNNKIINLRLFTKSQWSRLRSVPAHDNYLYLDNKLSSCLPVFTLISQF